MNAEVPSSIEVNKEVLQTGLNSSLETLRAMDSNNPLLEKKREWLRQMLEGVN